MDIANRQYGTFKIFDVKNSALVESSCAPSKISNYFVQSVLPWEISPAYFLPDVLSKYEADTVNYSLNAQCISFQDEWDVKFYGFSKTGLVYTFIRYLQPVPYDEQVHWQLFNVWPNDEDIRHYLEVVRTRKTGILAGISAHHLRWT